MSHHFLWTNQDSMECHVVGFGFRCSDEFPTKFPGFGIVDARPAQELPVSEPKLVADDGPLKCDSLVWHSVHRWVMQKKPGCLLYIGDYTTQSHRN